MFKFKKFPPIIFLISIFMITFLLECNDQQATQEAGAVLPNISQVDKAIDNGHFNKAKELIRKIRCSQADLPDTTEIALDFRLALIKRIKLDFNKTEQDIRQELAKYYPDLDDSMLKKWERDDALEMRIINGKKFYFHNAVSNLFRINEKAKAVKTKVEGEKEDRLDQIKLEHTREILDEVKESGKNRVEPVDMHIKYKLTVEPNAVPDGEIIRCWMPYPRTSRKRQKNIEFVSANVDDYIIAPQEYLQRTIYMEKKARKDKPTVFKYEFKYTSMAEYYDLEKRSFPEYNEDSEIYKKYTAQNPPHIVFSDRIKKLTESIVGEERDPYQKVKKIYEWIDQNIPWASALEYSTFRNIPAYVLDYRHGDCGMQTLLFITMTRYAGVPSKWQSGWMMHPGEVNLHDWAEVYYPEIGWVPVDQSFSLQNTESKDVNYYYTSGIDSYRLIVNDAFSKEFFPQKIHPRSETIDFQRGEVEWRGGNIYFNEWDYNMDVEYLE